jgi:hypothetical protein
VFLVVCISINKEAESLIADFLKWQAISKYILARKEELQESEDTVRLGSAVALGVHLSVHCVSFE